MNSESRTWKRLVLRQFKSFDEAELQLGPQTLLIGPNASGKSSLVQAFRLFSWLKSTKDGDLERFFHAYGRAPGFVKDGGDGFTVGLQFHHPKFEQIIYQVKFEAIPGGNLLVTQESVRSEKFLNLNFDFSFASMSSFLELSPVLSDSPMHRDLAHWLRARLWGIKVHQFHNTDLRSRIRSSSSSVDNQYLREDASNLAAYLLFIKNHHEFHFKQIEKFIKKCMWKFHEFILEEADGNILLRWSEVSSDMIFGPFHASDGFLRLVALATAIFQPDDKMPEVMVLDEPELGLHPEAISLLGAAIRSRSHLTHFVIATQSPLFLDEFDLGCITTINTTATGSVLAQVSTEAMQDWLELYSPAQMWLTRHLDGQPGEYRPG